MGGRCLPRVRDGLQLLPGALRRDARRDHRRLRRAHPPHDVAGRDPRARHPPQRRPLARHPRRVRARVGLPRRRLLRRDAHRARGVGGLARHQAGARRGGCRDEHVLRRPAAAHPIGPAVPAAPHDVRPPGTRDRSDARRGRLRREVGARLADCREPALRVLRRAGPRRHTAVAALRHRARQEARLPARLTPPRGRCARLVLSRSMPAGLVYLCVAVVGVGYAGAQMFPMAMLPDVASRTGEAQSRVGLYTGVWTAGETLGLALGPAVYAVVLASVATCPPRVRLSSNRIRLSTRSRSASRSCRPCSSGSRSSPCAATASTARPDRAPPDSKGRR